MIHPDQPAKVRRLYYQRVSENAVRIWREAHCELCGTRVSLGLSTIDEPNYAELQRLGYEEHDGTPPPTGVYMMEGDPRTCPFCASAGSPWQSRDLQDLAVQLRAFAAARDWEKFHSPKNLVMALAKEASELMEPFQWLSLDDSQSLPESKQAAVRQEIGDVLIYLVRLADRLGIDPLKAALDKLEENEKKYPAGRVKGNAAKYTEYEP